MKLRIIGSLLTIFIAANTNASIHPIKLTVGKLQYHQATGRFQLTINFFMDDFSAVLKKKYTMPLFDISNRTQAVKVVQDYTSENLIVKINTKEVPIAVKELNIIEENVLQVKCSLLIPSQTKIEEIEITNQFLFEAYDEQVNIFHVLIPQRDEKMLRFMPFQYRKKINF